MIFTKPVRRKVAPPDGGLITDALLSRWLMNEGSGSVVADSFGSSPANFTNMDDTNWVGPIAPNDSTAAVDFKAVNNNQFLDVPNDPYTAAQVSANGLTLCCFIRFDADGNNVTASLIQGSTSTSSGTAGGLEIQDKSTNLVALTARIHDGGWKIATELSIDIAVFDGIIRHVAATFDINGHQAVWIDGVEQASIDTLNLANFTRDAERFSIGANSTAAGSFHGIIDDARIYNRALSASELQQITAGTG